MPINKRHIPQSGRCLIFLIVVSACSLGHVIIAYTEVDICPVRLTVLMAARNMVCLSVLDEPCTSLLEMEGDIGIDTLLTDGENPVKVARSCVQS